MDKEQHDIIIYSSPDGKTNVSLMTRDGKVWINQSPCFPRWDTQVSPKLLASTWYDQPA